MYPVPVTLQTNDEGNLSEYIKYQLIMIDFDILQILSNISALTEKLCWHEDDYQAFIDSLGIYRNSSKVLADALDNPNHHNHNFLCSEIEQALRGITPINPFQHSQPESTDNLKRDSFFNNLQSRMWELYGYYGELSCKGWHGYPIGKAIDDLLYLSKQVAYLLPEDPNFKPYKGQQKGANVIKTQAQERHKKALELYDAKDWKSYAHFARNNFRELGFKEDTLSRLIPKLIKNRESYNLQHTKSEDP